MAHLHPSTESVIEAASDTTPTDESTAPSGLMFDDRPTTGDITKVESDDESVYLKGHPVIRNGMDVSKHLITTRDDGDPALTFRCVVLGTIVSALANALRTMYMFKPGVVIVSPVLPKLLILGAGKAWAHLTPPPERFKKRWVQSTLRFLNFGQPFGLKEHVVAAMIEGAGTASLPIVQTFAVQDLLYDRAVSATTAVLATFSTSLGGLAIAGLLRPLTVYPAEMVYWPSLPGLMLFQSLHFKCKANRRRLINCGWAFLIAAIWQLFPSYLFPSLTGISVVCLASAKASVDTRRIFTNIFGGASQMEGMGLLNFSFDWQYITSSPMYTPLKSQISGWIGTALSYPCVAALYYGNIWDAKNFPFMSSSLFRSDGTAWRTTSVLNNHGTIDAAKLAAVGLPNYSVHAVWDDFTEKISVGAAITHLVLFNGKDMKTAWRSFRNGFQPDPHYQVMLKYPEVPCWWYLACYVLTFIAGLIVVLKGETTLTTGTYILALVLGALLAPVPAMMEGLYGVMLPVGSLAYMTGSAALAKSPLAIQYFGTWSTQVISMTSTLTHQLKMGQYMKIPPRVLFGIQIYGALLGAVFNYGVMTFIMRTQAEILKDPIGNDEWTSSRMQAINSGAITWSLAKEMYGVGGKYLLVPLGLIIGAFLPLLHWGIVKALPSLKEIPIHTGLVAAKMGGPSGITSREWSRLAIGVFSQGWLRTRMPSVFNKYNHLVAGMLDGGCQITMMVLALAVQGASGKRRPFPRWWGNPAGYRDHCLK